MEYKLRISNTTWSFTDLICKNKTFNQRNKRINQEKISAILNLFFSNLTPSFIDYVINNSICFRTCLHWTQIHSFHNSWIWIQKSFFTKIFYKCHYLTTNRSIVCVIFLLLAKLFLKFTGIYIFKNKNSSLHRFIHQRAFLRSNIKPRYHCCIHFFQWNSVNFCNFIS